MNRSGCNVIRMLLMWSILFFLAKASFAAPKCSDAPSALPKDAKAILSSIPYGSQQTMVELKITGLKLAAYKDNPVLACYTLSSGVYLPGEFIRFDGNPSSENSDQLISGMLSILPLAPKGIYRVLLSDGTHLIDTQQDFTVRDSNTGQYADCPKVDGPVARNQSLFCSQALLDYVQTREIFGKGVADRYISVEVTVRNIDDNYEYILHDIRLGIPGAVVASIDRKLARGVSEKAEQYSARAIPVRLTEAGATLLTGIAGIVGNVDLTNAAILTAGPVQLGLKHALPDLSVSELNRMNDLGFSAGGIVIPKHSAVPLVAFLSADIFGGESYKGRHWFQSIYAPENCRAQTKRANRTATTDQPDPAQYLTFKCFDKDRLLQFQRGLIVQVSGVHVQEVNQAAVTSVRGSPLDLAELAKDGKETITLQGTGLDSVTAVHLNLKTGSTVVTYKPIASNPPDPKKLQFEIDAKSPPSAGTYSVTLDSGAQKDIPTSINFEVVGGEAPTITSVDGSPMDLSKLAKDTKETITLHGTALDAVVKVNLDTGGAPLSFSPQTMTPPDSTKLQFDIVAAKPPAKGDYTITLDTATQKAVPTGQKLSVVEGPKAPQ